MIYVILRFWFPLALVCTYAGKRGGSPERVAAAMLATAAIASVLVRPVYEHRYSGVHWQIVATDALLMIGLVWLAVRAARSWPIALAALHGTTLLGHLGRAEDPDLWKEAYFLMTTVPVLPGIATVGIGVWLHQRRLHRWGTDPSWRA